MLNNILFYVIIYCVRTYQFRIQGGGGRQDPSLQLVINLIGRIQIINQDPDQILSYDRKLSEQKVRNIVHVDVVFVFKVLGHGKRLNDMCTFRSRCRGPNFHQVGINIKNHFIYNQIFVTIHNQVQKLLFFNTRQKVKILIWFLIFFSC